MEGAGTTGGWTPGEAVREGREGNASALFERDDEELECFGRVVAQVAGDAGDVGVVERGINLVEHKEWRGPVAGTRG